MHTNRLGCHDKGTPAGAMARHHCDHFGGGAGLKVTGCAHRSNAMTRWDEPATLPQPPALIASLSLGNHIVELQPLDLQVHSDPPLHPPAAHALV